MYHMHMDMDIGNLPHVGVLTVEGAEHILKNNFNNYVKGRNLHDLLTELLGDGIFVSDGDAWQGKQQQQQQQQQQPMTWTIHRH
jgi:hypothetical protein